MGTSSRSILLRAPANELQRITVNYMNDEKVKQYFEDKYTEFKVLHGRTCFERVKAKEATQCADCSDCKKIAEHVCTAVRETGKILRRHNPQSKLCKCGNDNIDQLKVHEIDQHAFISAVKCKCKRTLKTACLDASWTLERIVNVSVLENGDHIVWHRWVGWWHHGLYHRDGDTWAVLEYTTMEGCSCSCKFKERNYKQVSDMSTCQWLTDQFLYRTNYDECYSAEYSVLRAKAMIDERQYNIISRNCEHSIRYCKTGITTSSQVEICGTALGKTTVMVLVRVLLHIVLGFVEYVMDYGENGPIYQENGEKNISEAYGTHGNVSSDSDICQIPKWVERVVGNIVMLLFAILFIVYLTKKEFDSLTYDDDKTYCFGRPPALVCGAAVRITVRELIAIAGPMLVYCLEDGYITELTNHIVRTIAIASIAFLANILCYVIGAFVGRFFFELMCCEHCDKSSPIAIIVVDTSADTHPKRAIENPTFDDSVATNVAIQAKPLTSTTTAEEASLVSHSSGPECMKSRNTRHPRLTMTI